MANLALFDFDGTITTTDTFTQFIRYSVDSRRMVMGKVILSPLIMAYKFGLMHASPLRASIVYVGFHGKPATDIWDLGTKYSREKLPDVIRPYALQRIKWHQAKGDRVAIVSASLDLYLTDWCQQLGLDLICTEVDMRDGIVTGRYRHGDCTGLEKAKRIRERYDLKTYPLIYAYGDTKDDEEMLMLAHKKYFRWLEVEDLRSAVATCKTGRSDPNSARRLADISEENVWLERLVMKDLS